MTRINLPEDLLVEILSKVPAITLARFRTTSKEWNTLIRDGRLAKKYYSNAPKQSLVILLNKFRVCLSSVNLCGVHNNIAPSVKITSQLRLRDPLSSSSEEDDIQDVSHCEGLLLCTTKDNRRVVWNPCSGKTMWIQPRNSYKDSDYYTIGYDKKSFCYKILRMDTFHIEYEVYDFTSNSWKNIHETRDLSISQMGSHVSVNGNTYCLGLSKEDPSGIILLCFDFSIKRLTVSLPEDSKGHFNHSDVALSVTREGKQLCM
ncbi:PREDICTED: putative F-box protein At3g21120 [Brassica oleracea var. oleracea]|uniref:F-box domain-containing protein n=1 Tax=Brassica oleracea var. oleracea TaxID=109376 RepID=A0A0D3BCI4_BRAOL|nr:PREDICTED: putative F-box protein At3g21120 [Brassica oleracea var. oleracea]